MEFSFNVEEPDPGDARLAGVKLAVRPDGKVPVAKVTAELKPPLTETLSVTDALPPGANETDGALALNWNAGVEVAPPPQWFTSSAASTEPRPVARS